MTVSRLTYCRPGGRGPEIGRADLLRLLASQPLPNSGAARVQVFAEWIRRLGFEDAAAPEQTKPRANSK
jgi:hypothetical protein